MKENAVLEQAQFSAEGAKLMSFHKRVSAIAFELRLPSS